MSHQLQQVTERRKISRFARSIANRKEPYRRVVELWQCAVCRSYWEYIREELRADGSIKHERWSMEVQVGRQEGGCL